MIQLVAALASLLALGGHALAPWRPQSAEPGASPAPLRWPLVALPLLLAATAAATLAVGARPDVMATLRAGSQRWPVALLGIAAVLTLSTALADGLLLLARERLERAGWWLVGGLGVALLLAASLAFEVLRAGSAAELTVAPLVAAAACRALLAVAAGEALAGSRPRWAPWTAAAIPGYWLTLPPALRELLAADGMLLTSAASFILLVAARWLPERLRRPGLIAAIALGGVLLARAVELTDALPLAAVVEREGS